MPGGDLIGVIVGAVVGSVGSYLGLYWKIRKELEAEYDKDLREERLTAYKALWALTQPLAKYARPEPITPGRLRKLSDDLRQWYFETGGIFLSESTRDEYFALQEELKARIAAHGADLSKSLTENDYATARKKGSRLRTAITIDVGTRRKPMIQEGDAA
jgi:hypothetical protein